MNIRIEELTAKVLDENPSLDRYKLAIAVAKRSDELENGAQSRLNVNTAALKSSDLALMEIAEGLIVVKGFNDIEK